MKQTDFYSENPKPGISFHTASLPDSQKNTAALTGLIFACLCIAGAVFSAAEILVSGLQLTYNRFIYAAFLLLICMILTCIVSLRKTGLFLLIPFIVVYLLLFILFRREISAGIRLLLIQAFDLAAFLYNITLNETIAAPESVSDLTVALLFFSVPAAGVYHLFVHLFRRVWILLLFTIPPVCLVLLLNFSPSAWSAGLVLFSFMGLQHYCSSQKTQIQKYSIAILLTITIFTSALTYFFYSVSDINADRLNSVRLDIIAFYKDHNLYKYSIQTEHNPDTPADTNTDTSLASGGISGGQLGNASGISYSGAEHLQLTVDTQPDSPLYLKGYTGKNYRFNSWTQEEELHYGGNQEYTMDSLSVHSMEYLNCEEKTLNIIPYITSDYSFYPYTAKHSAVSPGGVMTVSYYPEFYTMIRNNLDLLFVSEYTYSGTLSRDQIESNKEGYLAYPDSISEAVGQYYREDLYVITQSAAELTALIQYIQNTLADSSVYSLTPGAVPEGEDFISYFLLSNHRGYCMHFASAATMLFRAHGIPARYVEGYIAFPDDFSSGGSGGYNAVLEDNRAHAWTEIYVDDFGWIPIETTPPYQAASASGTEQPDADITLPQNDIPAVDLPDPEPESPINPETENLPAEETASAPESSAPEPGSDTPDEPLSTSADEPDTVQISSSLSHFFKGILAFWALTAIVMFRYFLVTWRKRLALNNRTKNEAVVYIYKELQRACRSGRKTENSFTAELTFLSSLSLKASFSQHKISREEHKQALQYYKAAVKAIYGRLSVLGRLRFRFLSCFVI